MESAHSARTQELERLLDIEVSVKCDLEGRLSDTVKELHEAHARSAQTEAHLRERCAQIAEQLHRAEIKITEYQHVEQQLSVAAIQATETAESYRMDLVSLSTYLVGKGTT